MRYDPIELTVFVGGPVLGRARVALAYYRDGRAVPQSRTDKRDAIAVLIHLDEVCRRIDRDAFYAWLYAFYARDTSEDSLGIAFYKSDLMREMRVAGLRDPALGRFADDRQTLEHIDREYLR